MTTLREVRRVLVTASLRHARVRDEAEDLAHDIIVAALRRGITLDDDHFVRSAEASARQHGAFVARTAARRRTRELLCSLTLLNTDADEANESDRAPSAGLPPALLTTLLLLSLGHTKAELRAALGLTDAALRKRLEGLRRRGPLAPPQFAERSPSSADLRRTQLAVVAELACRSRGRLIAVSDPEGHGIVFAEALTNRGATATTGASPPIAGANGLFQKEHHVERAT
jgi:hypothetical protein